MSQGKKETLGMYTIAEAARKLGVSRQTLHRAAKTGTIRVMRFGQRGGVVLISNEALEEYRKTRKRGRPKKSEKVS